MNELIKVETNENMEVVVSGRDLHEKLGIETPFKKWIDRMVEYGFTENIDFVTVGQKCPIANGGYQARTDYIIKLDMAKEICMIQRNEKGKMFRQYFIQVEKDYNSPERTIQRALLYSQAQVKKLEAKIEEDRPRVSFAETIEKSSDSILVRELSKILANENIHIGQNKLYSLLREWGYIFQNSTEPTQKAVQQGLFKINERVIKSVKGDILSRTTMVTGKGQVFLLDKIKRMGLN